MLTGCDLVGGPAARGRRPRELEQCEGDVAGRPSRIAVDPYVCSGGSVLSRGHDHNADQRVCSSTTAPGCLLKSLGCRFRAATGSELSWARRGRTFRKVPLVIARMHLIVHIPMLAFSYEQSRLRRNAPIKYIERRRSSELPLRSATPPDVRWSS